MSSSHGSPDEAGAVRAEPVPFESDGEVRAIAAGLCDLTLPKPQWTHRAHFAAAIWLLRHRPGFAGERDMPGIIRSYNEATGNPNTDSTGYHATITVASIRAARHVIDTLPGDLATFQIVNALLETRFGRKDWLLDHWKRDTLFSVAARRGWIEPDLVPLRF
ncbi:MAG: hypothetical protein M3R41_01265 [Pseudomonadota bacterium]|nr:hypothetical protein [Pseudomonadota bacterium]